MLVCSRSGVQLGSLIVWSARHIAAAANILSGCVLLVVLAPDRRLAPFKSAPYKSAPFASGFAAASRFDSRFSL